MLTLATLGIQNKTFREVQYNIVSTINHFCNDFCHSLRLELIKYLNNAITQTVAIV